MRGTQEMVVDIFENSNYNLKKEVDSSAILIIETQDEKSLDPIEQAAFRQAYPNAYIHFFDTEGISEK